MDHITASCCIWSQSCSSFLCFFFFCTVKLTLPSQQQMQNARSPGIRSVSGREATQIYTSVTHPVFEDSSARLSGTNCGWCTRSDPRKRSETLVSTNRLTLLHPHLPYLWWCISRINCSLSEWADWIDMFCVNDPFYTGGTNLCSHATLVNHFFLLWMHLQAAVFFREGQPIRAQSRPGPL